ncbi:AGE family epimerase/isomerase [Demequina pelophila]|uniref:AGE family epimerase/isomerase n=1 Tax=Demequina pelophila TaxID=1638984 RepID=UPI000781793F|nr:AGE family epimerase/isomerase [Demequina pelophila]
MTPNLRDQRADLLRFAARSKRPDGFGWLGRFGTVDAHRPVELWITCRMTHVASLGVLAGEPPAPGGPDRAALRGMALHGVRSLTGALHDDAHGGWFAAVQHGRPTVTAKQAYGHAFVVLAASSAVAAGTPGADALLDEALETSLARFWDEDEGLSVEEWDAAWATLDGYRGVNANMHTVEAYLAAGDVTGNRDWHLRADRIADQVVGWARDNDWRIPEHFDEHWTPLLEHHRDQPDHPFRPYGATVGHGLEWARLLLAIEGTLGDGVDGVDGVDDGRDSGFRQAAVSLYDRAVTDGWDADGAPGFVYTTDWTGHPVVRQRMHWVVAEAIGAAEALSRATGEARYAADVERWWDYADRFLIDHRYGSWHHELDTSNRPAASVWPGKPDVYHAYQAALLPELPLVPSFASALKAQGGLS